MVIQHEKDGPTSCVGGAVGLVVEMGAQIVLKKGGRNQTGRVIPKKTNTSGKKEPFL